MKTKQQERHLSVSQDGVTQAHLDLPYTSHMGIKTLSQNETTH